MQCNAINLASQVVLVVKNLLASAGDIRDLGSIPGLGRFPRGGHGNPLQYCCLENSHGQRSLEGYSPWGRKESDTMEQLSIAQHMPFPECNIYCWNHITCSLFTLTFT